MPSTCLFRLLVALSLATGVCGGADLQGRLLRGSGGSGHARRNVSGVAEVPDALRILTDARDSLQEGLMRLNSAAEGMKSFDKKLENAGREAQERPGAPAGWTPPTWKSRADKALAEVTRYGAALTQSIQSCLNQGPCSGGEIAGRSMTVVGSVLTAAELIQPLGGVIAAIGTVLAALFGASVPGAPPPPNVAQIKQAVQETLFEFEAKQVAEFDLPVWNEQVWTTFQSLSVWAPANETDSKPPEQASQFLEVFTSLGFFNENHNIQRSWNVVVGASDANAYRLQLASTRTFSEKCEEQCPKCSPKYSCTKWTDAACVDDRQAAEEKLSTVTNYLSQYYALAVGILSIKGTLLSIEQQPGWAGHVSSTIRAWEPQWDPMLTRAFIASSALEAFDAQCLASGTAFGMKCAGDQGMKDCTSQGQDPYAMRGECNYPDLTGRGLGSQCKFQGPGWIDSFQCSFGRRKFYFCSRPSACVNDACRNLIANNTLWPSAR